MFTLMLAARILESNLQRLTTLFVPNADTTVAPLPSRPHARTASSKSRFFWACPKEGVNKFGRA